MAVMASGIRTERMGELKLRFRHPETVSQELGHFRAEITEVYLK